MKGNARFDCLLTMRPAEFFIDDLEEIIWNEIMFSRLVLPGGENKLALAACKNKKRTNVDFDFVSGKGSAIRRPCSQNCSLN